MKLFRWFAAVIWINVAVAVAQAAAEFTEPGWFRSASKSATQHGTLDRSHEGEPREKDGSGGPLSLVSYPEIAEAITPEIQALARGLENNPANIFNYVHDHIRYVHYFGSKKGAQLTLLERSGNDFDQSALLVALLRAAGHTASYRFGIVAMPYEQWWDDRDFKHWLGLTKPATNLTEALDFAVELNSLRGLPLALADDEGGDDLFFHRVWVRLTLNATTYWFDPAFKIHQPISGINLAAAMRLDPAQLMTAAGGTSNTDYVVSLNEAALRNRLRDYTTNFLHWILSSNVFVNTSQNDQAVTNSYQRTNASYAITYAFDPDQEWLRQRQERLDQYRERGLADTSREVVTETLNVMGLNWMLQTERIPRVLAAQQNILLQHHHRFGRMAREFGRGYYIDRGYSLLLPANGSNLLAGAGSWAGYGLARS